MASTFPRKRSSAQQVAAILPDGNRVVRSLHTADPLEASQIADKVQGLVDALTAQQKVRQSVLRVLVEDIFLAASVPLPWGEPDKPEIPSFGSFAGEYIRRKEATRATKDFIQSTVTAFGSRLGMTQCSPPINTITGSQCQAWYDLITKNMTASSAHNRLKALSGVFAQAVRINIIPANPCAGVQSADPEDSVREPLTDEEIEKLLLWNLGDGHPKKGDSWQNAILLARWAGMRLGDAILCGKGNLVDCGNRKALRYIPRKTGRPVFVPLLPKLATELIGWENDSFCPALKDRRIDALSTEFSTMLEKAGIDTGKHEVKGRTKRTKTFHSLRHRFCSWLAESGIPEDLRKLMAGHSTSRSHEIYVHADAASIAKRLDEALKPTATSGANMSHLTDAKPEKQLAESPAGGSV